MRRLSLLRRAAAAVIGGTAPPTRTTTLTPALELRLARRAAAAVIGIRSYSVQPTSEATVADTSRPTSNSPAPARSWEIRRPTSSLARRTIHTAPPPQGEKGTATGPELAHDDDSQPDTSDWLTVVLDPPSPMVTDTSGTPVQPRRPRHALALAAIAAVLAIFFTAFGYQLRPLVHRQTPSYPVGSDEPSSTPSASDDKTSPAPVTKGDVPVAFLGSWTTTITNESGDHTRSIVIKQGHVGDDVLIATADGSAGNNTYHCVFTAPLTAAPHGADRLEIGPSTVTSGIPASSCAPGAASTLTLESDGRLRRSKGNTESDTYARTR